MASKEHKKVDFGFADIPAASKTKKVANIFSRVAPKYDYMNDIMSFGLHRAWKRYLLRLANIKPDAKVCDLASGTGDIALLFAQHLGKSGSITLSDINAEMLNIGWDKMLDHGCADIANKVLADAENLPFESNYFDIVTMGFGLRNVTDKRKALSEINRILKPGGVVLIMEFSQPRNNLLATLYDSYSLKVIPKMGDFFVKDKASYKYLVESIKRHPNQEKLLGWFYEAGFAKCDVTNIMSGVVAIHRGYKI
ncbi:MAG: bifunctional demethylmenaquinone methyltransferase/2-methoxy-6-polyprenyl-1,4-benzoquinol methylase UbiE [Pseudomonadota bacterium]|nr:bifunctional demethylmenaquinone methyltransferase/2-methoxy-6-polyprenyl-1,4-benzoquinol methylase UbiE [Pseudomonadota bacterium]